MLLPYVFIIGLGFASAAELRSLVFAKNTNVTNEALQNISAIEDDCTILCTENAGCVGFKFDEIENVCLLYGQTVNEALLGSAAFMECSRSINKDYTTPYEETFCRGLEVNDKIYVNGTVPSGASRFNVNLKTDATGIALKFEVTFDHGGDTLVVLRNSRIDGIWGVEERNQPNFPFAENQNFSIIILCEAIKFKVSVNGVPFIEFNHRAPYNQVSLVKIKRDVVVTGVLVEQS